MPNVAACKGSWRVEHTPGSPRSSPAGHLPQKWGMACPHHCNSQCSLLLSRGLPRWSWEMMIRAATPCQKRPNKTQLCVLSDLLCPGHPWQTWQVSRGTLQVQKEIIQNSKDTVVFLGEKPQQLLSKLPVLPSINTNNMLNCSCSAHTSKQWNWFL